MHGRHIGPQGDDETLMLAAIGYASRRDLIRDTVPAGILRDAPLALCEPTTEAGALAELQAAFPQLRVTKLGRFLKASNGDLAHAKACLTKHMAWLGSLPVDLRTAALPELRKGKLYLRGQDRLGREMLIRQVRQIASDCA